MADAAFPRDPFAPPSPLSTASKKEGYAMLAVGRTPEGLSILASASAREPSDTILTIAVSALQAWFGRDQELANTRRRALEYARHAPDPVTADRTAKICFLRPSGDRAQRDAALDLARKAVALDKGHAYMP
jgi:hypothetical protein